MPVKRSASSDISDFEDSSSPSPTGSASERPAKASPGKKDRGPGGKAQKEQSDSPKGKRVRQGWTDAEEAIFAEVAAEVLKKVMWSAIKEDGRLVHRGADGVKKHTIAVVNKWKKDAGGQ